MDDEPLAADALEQRLDEVIALYLASEDAGEAPAPRDWISRYPDLAPQLKEFFASHQQVGRWAGRDSAPSRRAGPFEETQPLDGAGTVDLSSTQGDAGGPQEFDYLPRPFGPYELLERIGRGGQGVVYKARQRNPQRIVALKMILAGGQASADEIRRFRDEADAVAELDHPNIVPIYEVGAHQDRWFFSMRLMEGGSLDLQLDRFRRDPRSAAHLLVTLARAVQHAHRRGILHRDLKPSNILFDAGGRPHVTDFGLAKRIEADETTRSGILVGTPRYMAPEQATGHRGTITTATDVYGLGAILYTALRGRPPFLGDSALEVLEQVKAREPEPLSAADRGIDRDLETICLTCLNKDPQRRYGSAEALAEDLERWLDGRPIRARRTSGWERALKWARRQPAVAALLGALVLLAILGFSLVTWQWRRADAARREVTTQALALAGTNDRLRTTLYLQKIALAEREWTSRRYGRAVNLLDECPEGMRGWEWFYLVGLRHRTPMSFRAHEGEAYDVTFSPDGEILATAGGDHVIRLWDSRTGRPLRSLAGHESRVRSVAFSPDGRLLASASWDQTVKVWEVASGRARETLAAGTRRVISVAFSPDGRLLASGGSDGIIRLWDTTSWREPRMLPAQHGVVLRVVFSPDGRSLASAGDDGSARLWDVRTGRASLTLPRRTDTVHGLSFRGDGRRLAVARGDGTIRVWDVAAVREILRSMGGHTDSVRDVTFSPDGRRLASASSDATVKVWDADSGQEAITLRTDHGVTLRALAYSLNGRRLAASGSDGIVRIWDATPPASRGLAPLLPFANHYGVIYSVAASPDNRTVASCGGDHAVRIWDMTTGRELAPPLLRSDGQIYTVTFSDDGRYLAAGDGDGSITLWDGRTFRELSRTHVNQEGLWCLALSRDGRRLAVGGADAVLHVWDIQAGAIREPRAFSHPRGDIWAVAFSPDGRLVATGSSDRMVRVWSIMPGEERPVHELGGHADEVYGVAFSPDGRSIASASLDRTVRIWDARSGSPGPVRSFDDRLDSLAFSPDGRFLVAACGDGSLKVLDPLDLGERLVLYGHTSRVLCVAFSRDGRRIISSGFDRTARIWDTADWPRGRGPEAR